MNRRRGPRRPPRQVGSGSRPPEIAVTWMAAAAAPIPGGGDHPQHPGRGHPATTVTAAWASRWTGNAQGGPAAGSASPPRSLRRSASGAVADRWSPDNLAYTPVVRPNRDRRQRWLVLHAGAWLLVGVLATGIWWFAERSQGMSTAFWPGFVLLLLLIPLALHAAVVYVTGPSRQRPSPAPASAPAPSPAREKG